MSSTTTLGKPAPPDARLNVRQLTARALALRLAVAIAIHFTATADTFAPDQLTYHLGADEVAKYWAGETVGTPWPYHQAGRNGYYFLVAAQYFLVGAWPLVPKLVNAAAGALAVPWVVEIASRVTGDWPAALRAGRYVAYFPSLVLWSALNIRDVWVVLLILLIAREAMRLQEGVQIRSLLLLGAAILTIVQFRDYIFFAVAAPVLVSFVIRTRGNVARNAVIALIVASVVVVADHVTGTGRSLQSIDLETLSEIRAGTAIGGASSFDAAADISTPTKALQFLPRGLAFFLLGPFPWAIANLRQAFTVPEMLFFYALLPSMIGGILFLVRNRLRDSIMILLITAAVTLGYALGQANQGTAYRHRAQVLPFYLMLGALGVELRRSRATRRYSSPGIGAR
jgi:hypothetical protein